MESESKSKTMVSVEAFLHHGIECTVADWRTFLVDAGIHAANSSIYYKMKSGIRFMRECAAKGLGAQKAEAKARTCGESFYGRLYTMVEPQQVTVYGESNLTPIGVNGAVPSTDLGNGVRRYHRLKAIVDKIGEDVAKQMTDLVEEASLAGVRELLDVYRELKKPTKAP